MYVVCWFDFFVLGRLERAEEARRENLKKAERQGNHNGYMKPEIQIHVSTMVTI